MKILYLALGLFLSALSVQAADADRFLGGSYDGWDRAEGKFRYSLLSGQPGWAPDDAVSNVTATGAAAGCTLLGTNAQAHLFWGTDNAATNWTWENTNFFGDPLSIGRVDGVAIGNLTADTKYYYIFYATNSESGLSSWSAGDRSFSSALTGLAVTDLTAAAVSPAGVDLSWTDSFRTETGYAIERSNTLSGGWAQLATVGAGSTGYADRAGLAAGETYSYRIAATNEAGLSEWSSPPAVVTTPIVSLSSGADQVFDWRVASAALAPLTIEVTEPAGLIANGGTMRVRVPAGWPCRFDTAAAVFFSGDAAGKVGAAGYSDDGRALLIPVTADFAAADTLTVEGLKLADLRLVPAGVARLELDLVGAGAPAVTDLYTLEVRVQWAGGSYDGWDRVVSAGYTPVARLTGAVLMVR